MSDGPLVSIVMPLYNAEKTVADAIRSVLNQSYRNFELIVVDDGSTDESASIVAEIMKSPEGDSINLMHQQHAGVAAAQNKGLNAARGEYIALLDADDLWHPEKLERHVKHLGSHKEVGVSYSYSQFINISGKKLPYFQKPKLKNIALKDLLCRHPVSNGSTTVFKRDILDALRLEDEENGMSCYVDGRLSRSHDVEMWVRAGVKSSLSFEGIGEVLTYYRLSSQSYSSALEEKRQSFDQAMDIISGYAPELITRCGKLARAYHLCYLSRRAISLPDAKAAIHYFWRAVFEAPRICVEEPFRTLETGIAAYVQFLISMLGWPTGKKT